MAKMVESISFGLFLGVSASKSTGASRPHYCPKISTTFYHFHPHLTPKWFVVNMKLNS